MFSPRDLDRTSLPRTYVRGFPVASLRHPPSLSRGRFGDSTFDFLFSLLEESSAQQLRFHPIFISPYQAQTIGSYYRSSAIDEKIYGPEHTAVARNLNNLAGLLEYTDRLAEAEALYRRAKAIFEKNLGVNHPDVGTTLNNLAQVLKKMNRMDEAEPLSLRAVRIFVQLTRIMQQLDPRLQMAINNYGRLLKAMGRSMEQIHSALHEIAPDLYRQMYQGTPCDSHHAQNQHSPSHPA